MPNPFKESAKKEKVAPGSKPTTVEEQPVETKEQQPPTPIDPLAGLVVTKPDGKTYSFYLSPDVVEKLDKAAKKNKCSKSKVLDALIRNFL